MTTEKSKAIGMLIFEFYRSTEELDRDYELVNDVHDIVNLANTLFNPKFSLDVRKGNAITLSTILDFYGFDLTVSKELKTVYARHREYLTNTLISI